MENQVIYTHIGGSQKDGIFACGYMNKKSSSASQIDFMIPYYSIFILINGEGKYCDEKGASEALCSGSVVQRLPGRRHSTYVKGDGKWKEFFISFGHSMFDTLIASGLLNGENAVSKVGITEDLLHSADCLLADIVDAQKNKNFDRGLLISNYFKAVDFAVQLADSQNQENADFLLLAKTMLGNNFSVDINEQDIIKHFAVSYETFRKKFKAEAGISPMRYRHEKAMKTAAIMLVNGASISETAASMGYSDVYSFSKQFKIFYGVSPRDYVKTEFYKFDLY